MFNQITIIGRIGQDLEVKQVNGKSVLNFSVATSKKYKDKTGQTQEQTQWHRVTAWDKPAEIISNYCVKGSLIMVQGELQYREYEVKGEKKTIAEIYLQTFNILNSPKEAVEPKGQAKPLQNFAPGSVNTKEEFPF